MKTRKFYRDGLEEEITGELKTKLRPDGFTVEEYTLATGEKRFFVIKGGTNLCAHGDTESDAIADALWKDENNRPSIEALKEEIQKAGYDRPITLSEFRLLTGACLTGCRDALKAAKRDTTPLPAREILKINKEWGMTLLRVLEWDQGGNDGLAKMSEM